MAAATAAVAAAAAELNSVLAAQRLFQIATDAQRIFREVMFLQNSHAKRFIAAPTRILQYLCQGCGGGFCENL